MNLMTSDTCPWCHLPSVAKERMCRRCGHFARIPQIYCECAACTIGRPAKPVGLPEVVDA